MKTTKNSRRISAVRPSTVRLIATRPLSLFDRPAFDMALRIGTAALMAFAAMLVLAHLTVYSLSLTHENFARTQSTACVFGRC
jgi:hypothetical protein